MCSIYVFVLILMYSHDTSVPFRHTVLERKLMVSFTIYCLFLHLEERKEGQRLGDEFCLEL